MPRFKHTMPKSGMEIDNIYIYLQKTAEIEIMETCTQHGFYMYQIMESHAQRLSWAGQSLNTQAIQAM